MRRGLLVCMAACILVMVCMIVFITRRCGSNDPGQYVDGDPRVSVVAGLLTPAECAAIIDAAVRKGLQRSTTIGKDRPASRTSDHVFLKTEDDPVVGVVESKVAALLGADPARFESLQVIRYREGQEYKAHYDPHFKTSPSDTDLLREHTVVMYLNDDFDGGCTSFPFLKRDVHPVAGSALVFTSMTGGKIIRESKHQGKPPTRGTKWAATIWVSVDK